MLCISDSIFLERERITLTANTFTTTYECGCHSQIAVNHIGRNCYLAVLHEITRNDILTILLYTMDYLVTVKIMAMQHFYCIKHITGFRHNRKYQRLIKCNLSRQSITRCRQQRAIVCRYFKSNIRRMHIENHITYSTAILYYSVTILCTASRVNRSPIDLVTHAVETGYKVSRQGKCRRIEYICIIHSLAITVITHTGTHIRLCIRESHSITVLRYRSITVENNIECTVHATVKIDKTMHPITCKTERRSERLARNSLKATICYIAIHLQRCRQLQGLLTKRNAVQATAAMCIVLLLVKDYRIIFYCILIYDNHAVNVTHICVLIEKTYDILSLLEHYVEFSASDTAPSAGVACICNSLPAVYTQLHGAVLSCNEIYTQSIFTALFAEDISPLQVVLFATAEPTDSNAAGTYTALGIYCSAIDLVILQFLITSEPCSLSLIYCTFKAFVSLKFVYTCAMSRNVCRQRALINTLIGLCEQVAHLYLTCKIELREIHTHLYCCVCRIIERNDTFGAILLLYILHKHISTILTLYNV